MCEAPEGPVPGNWGQTLFFRSLLSGLLDPHKGRGFYATYNAGARILRYPLDYVFHSADFRLVQMRTLKNIGSDHFPLLLELSHEPDAKGKQDGPSLDADDRERADETVREVSDEDV